MNTILFPSLIFLIIVAIIFVGPKVRSIIGSVLTWRRNLILAGVYLGILILLVPMLYMLPNNDFTKLMEDRNQAEKTISQNSFTDLNNNLPLVGDFDQQNGLYKNSSHTFKVDTTKLAVIVDERMTGDYQIFVERKSVDDEEIEISTFVTTQPPLKGSLDFTKLISPPTITFQKDTLSLMSASRQTVDFTQFNADFTVDQFKKHNYGGASANFGQNVIYIRVPKSLELDKGKYSDQIQVLSSR